MEKIAKCPFKYWLYAYYCEGWRLRRNQNNNKSYKNILIYKAAIIEIKNYISQMLCLYMPLQIILTIESAVTFYTIISFFVFTMISCVMSIQVLFSLKLLITFLTFMHFNKIHSLMKVNVQPFITMLFT